MATTRTAERMGEYIGPTSSRVTALTYQRGEYIYEVQKATRSNLEGLRTRAIGFEGLLEYGPFRTPAEVTSNIQPGSEVIFASYRGRWRRMFGLPAKDVGVMTLEVKTATIEGRPIKVISTGVRAVAENFQKHGIGTDFVRDAILRHRPDAVTGRSRNWKVYRSLEKIDLFKNGSISPIDKPFPPEAPRALEQVLARSKIIEMDLQTGLVRDIYPKKKPKDFTPRKGHVAGWRIHDALIAKGVPPGGTNGLRYWVETDQDAIDAALPEYQRLLEPEPLTPSKRPLLQSIAEKVADFLQV